MTAPLEVIALPAYGAEDVVVGTHGRHEGAVFTGTADGGIWRISHDLRRLDRVADTGGRPLGIEYDADGLLVVCDADRGLLRVDPDTGGVEVLADRVDGVPLLVCNNAALADEGTIWFSDSSQVFSLDRWKDDFLQVTRTGRLLRRDPGGEVQVVLDGLAFANGVALSADGSSVLVAESSTRTVVRHRLSGDRAGETDLLVPALPGYPDNIARGSDGLIWVAIGTPRDPMIEGLMRAPLAMRRLAMAVPERLQPQPKPGAWMQAYDDAGALVHDCRVATADFHMVTGVREHAGTVWVGSLREAAIARTRL